MGKVEVFMRQSEALGVSRFLQECCEGITGEGRLKFECAGESAGEVGFGVDGCTILLTVTS